MHRADAPFRRSLAKSAGTLLSERTKIIRQTQNNVADNPVARGWLADYLREFLHLTMHGCEREWRLLESEALDRFTQPG
jgi:hypothetical protein